MVNAPMGVVRSTTDLLLTEIFPPQKGGSGRWFYEVYRRLPRERFVIAAGQYAGQEEFDRGHNLRLTRLPLSMPDWGVAGFSGLRGYLRILHAVRSIVAREGISRLHCGRCLLEGWVAFLLKKWLGLPYVCYVHGEDVNLTSTGELDGVMSSRQLRWMTRLTLRGADSLIANSQNTVDILQRQWKVQPERIHLLHPGVDVEQFYPAPFCDQQRARLGWGGRLVILTVGRLQKRKGHDTMIRALHAVRAVFPDVLYAVVGSGDEEERLKALVSREGLTHNVAFLGEVGDENLVRCYQQCDLFVLPNRQVGNDIEGFGMVLLEAQACGKPVIAGTSGGTAETMRIPETGRVVDCDDSPALADHVVTMLSDRDLCCRMGRAAREWVCKHFDWNTLSQRAANLFGIHPLAVPSMPGEVTS